ncbi:DeoR/GlpR family DNA-binding transcription regulator [Pacificibacter marinus]|uniref:Glycerol-3-phosphate regulon repressor n=1 Tax=Pacificibacter marinus TaxID=658057 RepID=A0A1Y5TDG2_9RHOB|nr:DeoR/GlpR family DNA-binding transcription regulator [Pacificibacter marinus]SEL08520.1 transcriptional regulator, DeoR family [Pacificibacter marinus]SLN57898.1 Glycerol-3-phosphate regulon repressor [Pacificibacter marinus]
MKREDRKQAIMDLLVSNGAVDLDDLAQRFTVSKMTIHRDLDDLETAGVMRKIRGGGTIDAGTQFESDFRFRAQQDRDAKNAMAETALTLIEPGMTVMINDGSMAATLGARLPERRPLTVITNNAAILESLKNETGITLIATGGVYSAKFNGYFGMMTEAALTALRADVAFISAPAVSGLEVFHMNETVVRAKRAMIAAGAKTYLLVHHNRFGRTALHKLADLSEFDAVITDAKPDADSLTAIDQANLKLTFAVTQGIKST